MRTEEQFKQFIADVMEARHRAGRKDLNFDSRNYILLVDYMTRMDVRSNAKANHSGWVISVPNKTNSGYNIEVVGFLCLQADIESDTGFMLVKRAFN